MKGKKQEKLAQNEAQVRFEYTLNSLSARLAHHHLRAWPLSGCYTQKNKACWKVKS